MSCKKVSREREDDLIRWERKPEFKLSHIIIVGLTVPLLFLAYACCLATSGCSDFEASRLEALDNGLMTNPQGEPLRPHTLPWAIAIDQSVQDSAGNDGVDSVYEVVEWFNESASRDGKDRLMFFVDDLAEAGELGVLSVSVGLNSFSAGSLVFWWNNGLITTGDVTILYDISYDRTAFEAVLKHELGHALGLADDPGPPRTVDLNSIMASPMVYHGEWTDHDWRLVVFP